LLFAFFATRLAVFFAERNFLAPRFLALRTFRVAAAFFAPPRLRAEAFRLRGRRPAPRSAACPVSAALSTVPSTVPAAASAIDFSTRAPDVPTFAADFRTSATVVRLAIRALHLDCHCGIQRRERN
jgi:hypothetical protein